MKTIQCPYCQSHCEIGTGYYHDEKLNIRCTYCTSVIFATSEEDEAELLKLRMRPDKETHEPTAPSTIWPNVGHKHHSRYLHEDDHHKQQIAERIGVEYSVSEYD